MTKRAAKAATPSKRARKTPAMATTPATELAAQKTIREIPEHLLVPVNPGEWPTNLDADTAEKLFEAVYDSNGMIEKAAKAVGLKPATVRQWKKRHPRFAESLAEWEEIAAEAAIENMTDFVNGIHDREGAAAAREKRENCMEILRAKFPQRFKTSPFKPVLPGTPGDIDVLGVVLVPMKNTQVMDARPVIEGQTVVVPPKQALPR